MVQTSTKNESKMDAGVSADDIDEATARHEAERLAAVRRYDILDTPPDGAFDRICALAARIFAAPVATVTIVDEKRIWFKAQTGIEVAEIPRESGLCASAILQGEPYIVNDARTDPRTIANSLVTGEMGVQFYAAAPIVTRDGFQLGTINVIDTEPRETNAADEETLRDLAAIVLDEMELRLSAAHVIAAERELRQVAGIEQARAEEISSTLQRSLKPPSLPDIPGLEIAAHYEPFSEIGGDFYDVFPMESGRWGFFLGDVVGKGPEAARLISLARYTLRTAAMLKEDLGAILTDLNSALLMELDGQGNSPTCTVVYGEIDVSKERTEVSLAAAGHPAPIVVRSTHEAWCAPASGTLLGAIEDVAFDTCRLSLGQGDALVLYTDGILDLEINGSRSDEEWLARSLSDAPEIRAPAIIDWLNFKIAGLEGPLRDDAAILVFSR
jgi:sigma-B regulation protein RsbU (phosphoserine phosphatase)